MPDQIEKRRVPAGQAWAVFLFGSFILIRDIPVAHPAGAFGIQIHS